jgi:hypothetical protein
MALNVGLEESYDNMNKLKGKWQKAGKVNNTEAYIEIGGFSVKLSVNVALIVE